MYIILINPDVSVFQATFLRPYNGVHFSLRGSIESFSRKHRCDTVMYKKYRGGHSDDPNLLLIYTYLVFYPSSCLTAPKTLVVS